MSSHGASDFGHKFGQPLITLSLIHIYKILGGQFIIDGKEMESSLFNMIKKTTNENPNKILSAYKDLSLIHILF